MMRKIAVRVKRRAEEDAIQGQIIELLKVAAIDGLIYFAVPNGGKRPITTAKILQATGVLPGVPDLVLVDPVTRIAHFMEVKTTKGVLSDGQEKFMWACMDLNIPWALVRSRDEAQDALTRWGFLRIVKMGAAA